MPSETVVTGTDEYGNERYKALYEELMYDVGKLAAVEKSYLVLKPKVPLFIISVKMKALPAAKTIGVVASTRSERDTVYVSISDEMYAPGTLRALWHRYGRDNVQQLDRLDIAVKGVSSSFEVDEVVDHCARNTRKVRDLFFGNISDRTQRIDDLLLGRRITAAAVIFSQCHHFDALILYSFFDRFTSVYDLFFDKLRQNAVVRKSEMFHNDIFSDRFVSLVQKSNDLHFRFRQSGQFRRRWLLWQKIVICHSQRKSCRQHRPARIEQGAEAPLLHGKR